MLTRSPTQITLVKFKSDLCRLAQLYLDGGMYLDNDIELLKTFEDGVLNSDGVNIITSLTYSENAFFQAILASPPRHPFILRNLNNFKDMIEGNYEVTSQFGPRLMIGAFINQYNVSGRIDRQKLLDEHGVYLLKEALLAPNHDLLKVRSNVGHCNVVIEGLPRIIRPTSLPVNLAHDDTATIYGFSRVIRSRSNNAPCNEKLVHD